MQARILTACLVALLCLMGSNAWGQVWEDKENNVFIHYHETNSTITIENKSGSGILLYKKDLTKSQNGTFGVGVKKCNLNINPAQDFLEIPNDKTSDSISVIPNKDIEIIYYKVTWNKGALDIPNELSKPIPFSILAEDFPKGQKTKQQDLKQSETKQQEQPEFTITYNVNGGTFTNTKQTETEKVKTDTEITLPSITKADHDFKGWKTDNKNYKAGEKHKVTKDVIFTAEYTKHTKKVIYVDNNQREQVVEVGDKISLPTEPKKDGHALVWQVDGSTVEIAAGEEYIVGKNDVKFTAKWIPDATEFIIKYDANGGEPISQTKVTANTSIALPSAKRKGYIFDGWQDKVNKKDYPAGSKTYQFTKNVTLTAKWTQEPDKIDVFKKRKDKLQKECDPLLKEDYELTKEDSIFLEKKLQDCEVLNKEIENFKPTQKEENTVKEFNTQLKALSEKIAVKLTPKEIPIDELIKDFKKAVSYDEIKDGLDAVKKFIDDKKYKSDWYKWFGRWNVLADLTKIDAMVDTVKYNHFIDSISELPEYQNATIFINYRLKNDFRDNIQNKATEYRKIIDEDFEIPILKLSIFGAIILIFIIVAIILLYMIIHNKKKEKEKEEEEKERIAKLGKSTFKKIDKNNDAQPEDAALLSTADKPKFKQLLKKYDHGLWGVKATVDKLYKEINMFDFVEDWSIHNVYISRDFVKELYKFFTEFLKSDGKVPETGCHIIGRWDYAPNTNQQAYDISLEYMVKPGSDARYSEFECDFGVEIGTSLVMDNRKYSKLFNTEYVHTSWMHSHPGLQLFLSKQDLIVQATLTNNSPYKRMLAIVIDTKDENLEMAFFPPKTSEQHIMNNDNDLKKTITLDELLEWAKTPYVEPQKTEPEDDVKIIGTPSKEYFDIPLAKESNHIAMCKITRAVSVDMLTSNEGILIGKHENNQIFIDELGGRFVDASGRIGFFKEISSFENNEEWEKQKRDLLNDEYWKSSKVLVIYCLQEDNLYFFTGKPADTDLEIQNLPNIATIIPFQELKKWTRENRN